MPEYRRLSHLCVVVDEHQKHRSLTLYTRYIAVTTIRKGFIVELVYDDDPRFHDLKALITGEKPPCSPSTIQA